MTSEAVLLEGRDVLVGNTPARVLKAHDDGTFTVEYGNGIQTAVWRDDFWVLPTRDEIAEVIHAKTANHPWRGEDCSEGAQRVRLKQADAVLALLLDEATLRVGWWT
jgi:uncharacterized protein YcbX